jgi:hypothetical protein
MDLVTLIIIIAAAAVGVLVLIFFMRKRRIRRLTKEVRDFTHGVLSKRLRVLNDQVRHVLFDSLENIHKTPSGVNFADELAAAVHTEVFGMGDDAQIVNIAEVRKRLEQSPTLLHHCKMHCEKAYNSVQTVLRRNGSGNVFRGPHQKKAEDDDGSDVGAAEDDLDAGRPGVGAVYCCLCCIGESTEKEALRDNQLLYFYSMAHRMCCARGTPNGSEGDQTADVEMTEPPAESLTIEVAGVSLTKMLHPGNCIARQFVEVTAHSKRFLTVSPPPVSVVSSSSLRAIVDVAPAPRTMYERDESDALLSEIFLWRPAGALAAEGGPSLGQDLTRAAEKSNDDDEGERRMWVAAAQDRHFFSAEGLRDDLFTYFVNLRRTLLMTANTDKQVMGMYDAVRIFDVATKMWMLAATKTVVAAVAAEWEKRVLLQARKIVQEGRRELDTGIDASAAGDESLAETDALGAADAISSTVSSVFPTTTELLATVLQKWLDDLHDSFAISTPVPQARKGGCCRRCISAFPAVTSRLPETDTAIAKALQSKLRAAALSVVLSEDQKLEAVTRAAPIRERLVDLIFPSALQAASRDEAEFSPRERKLEQPLDDDDYPPPPDPPPRPPTSHEEVAIDLSAAREADDEESAQLNERSLVVRVGLRDSVDEVTEFIEEAMSKIELEIAERLLLQDASPSPASPAELKAYLKLVRKSTARLVGFASKHLSLMVDAAVSSRALCSAAHAGRTTSDAFKVRLTRLCSQISEFSRNMKTHGEAAEERSRAGHSVLLNLTPTGFVLGGAAAYSFVPMHDVVASYNFHAVRFPELPQGLIL